MTALSGEFALILLIAGAAGAAAKMLGLKRGQLVGFAVLSVGFILNYHTTYACDKDMFQALVGFQRDGDTCDGALTVVSLGSVLLRTGGAVVGVFFAAILAVLALKRAWRFATVNVPAWWRQQVEKVRVRRRQRKEKSCSRRMLRDQRRAEKQARRIAKTPRRWRPLVWIGRITAGLMILVVVCAVGVLSYGYGVLNLHRVCVQENWALGFYFNGRCRKISGRDVNRYVSKGYLQLIDPDVNDFKALENMTRLQGLNLSSTQVSDLTPLSGLTGLQRLELYGTQVSDVAPLSGLTGLQELYLSSTQVRDVTPLSGLTELQVLWLNETQVSDVTPLSGLTGLQELHLYNTEVSDVTPLSGLTGLQKLDLGDTQVSDLTPLAGMTELHLLYTPDGWRHGGRNNTPANRAAVARGIREWRPAVR